ncbi:MAG: hypothetical protein HYX61_11785 [Gammaproteobacteria bacterium]|jgi:hypothetical protein|nr:hypothetical protein [Gammaproteobacteria bacterium]
MLKGTKKSKSRVHDDKAYNPRTANRRPYNPDARKPESIFYLMDSADSPAKKALLVNNSSTKVTFSPEKPHPFLSPSKAELSTPQKGPMTCSAYTPKGSKLVVSRLIECEDGTAMGIFLPENKVHQNELVIPDVPNPWIAQSPIPKADMNGIIDFKITKESIRQVEAVIRKRLKEGQPQRLISQQDLMKISAVKALRNAGIEVPAKGAHHTHLTPHCYQGDDGQCVNNLGIATKQANAAMELVNPAIKEALFQKDALPALYLSAIPEWVKGYENIRLLKTITYIIKDAPGDNPTRSATIRFNMLSTDPVCLTDVLPIRKFIIEKFSNKPVLENVEKDESEESEESEEKENVALNSPSYYTPSFDRKRKFSPPSTPSSPYTPSTSPFNPVKKLIFPHK